MTRWIEENNRLTKKYTFKDFKEALSFVNKVGERAEEKGHHPDISIHDYNKVSISLTTHDEGGVTEKDHELAESIDKI